MPFASLQNFCSASASASEKKGRKEPSPRTTTGREEAQSTGIMEHKTKRVVHENTYQTTLSYKEKCVGQWKDSGVGTRSREL